GVSSRGEAARWTGAGEDTRKGTLALTAPFALLRRGLAPSIAVGAGTIVLAAVALLAFGVVRTTEDRSSSATPAAAMRPVGAGERATEAGIVPWQTYRISGADLPHAITVPFTEYMLATEGRPSAGGAPAPAPPTGTTSYRLQFVRADDGVTPVGPAGGYIPGATPLIQPPA